METNQPIPADIDAYIADFPPDVQAILRKIRAIIRAAAPDAVETIKYRMPTFVSNGANLVHFAAFKHHVGVYPTPSATEKFKQELSPYAGDKGSVRFPLSQPIPYDLIEQMVAFRVTETAAKAAAKSAAAKAKSKGKQ